MCAALGGQPPGAAQEPPCAFSYYGAVEKVEVSVIVVNWRSEAHLPGCLGSLREGRGRCAVELIVVDNGSAALEPSTLTAVWPELRLLRNATNRGFAAAANQGAAMARGELLFFLNPDTQAVGLWAEGLVRAFTAYPEVVAVAPQLLSTPHSRHGQERFQLRHLPTWGQALRELFFVDQLFPDNPFFLRDRYLTTDRQKPFFVEQPAAAALAVRKAVFWQVGGFDEQFFPAWFEDVDLCARLLKRGKILFFPQVAFTHLGGEAAHALGYDQFLPIFYRNALRYWQKHRGRSQAALYRLAVMAGMVLRLAVLPLRPAVPRPRREAAKAYLNTLRSLASSALTPMTASRGTHAT